MKNLRILICELDDDGKVVTIELTDEDYTPIDKSRVETDLNPWDETPDVDFFDAATALAAEEFVEPLTNAGLGSYYNEADNKIAWAVN